VLQQFEENSMEQTQQSEIIFLVEEEPEGGYIASAIGESIFTQGETLAELQEMNGTGCSPMSF
jgi:hypothetical protein